MRNNQKDRQKKSQALKKLFEENEKLLRRLFAKSEKLYLECIKGKVLAVTGADIVYGLIEKLLDGSRKWDVDKFPSAYTQVDYYLRREITNLRSKEKKILEAIDIDAERVGDAGIITGIEEETADEKTEADRIYEMAEECREFIKENGNYVQQKIFDGMYNGKGNVETAKDAGVSVREIENEKKKLKRKLKRKFPKFRVELK